MTVSSSMTPAYLAHGGCVSGASRFKFWVLSDVVRNATLVHGSTVHGPRTALRGEKASSTLQGTVSPFGARRPLPYG